MNKKFYILPQNGGEKFRQILKAIPATPQEKQILQEASIKHVEIDLNNNSWEILMQTYNGIPDELLTKAASYISHRCNIPNVIFYQDIIDLPQEVTRHWQTIIQNAAGTNPTLYSILTQATHSVDGNRIMIDFKGSHIEDILRSHNVEETITHAVQAMVHCPCKVICRIDNENNIPINTMVNPLDSDIEKENYLRQLQQQSQSNVHHTAKTQTASNTNENGFNNNQPKFRRSKTERKLIIDTISDEPIEITSIDGEMKNITLRGRIFNINTREFNTGTILLTFDLADESDGISCKVFLKTKDEFTEVNSALQKADIVKIKGAIRFDSYLNDYVMMPNNIAMSELPKREDRAIEKRVELHAHTHMSNMDAVVSATDLINTAVRWGWPAIAITDHGVVQAFPEAMKAAKGKDIKIIYGIEGYLTGDDYQQRRANHIIMLAKNSIGLHNIYRMVSLSHLKYLYKSRPRLPKKIISELREGVIIGSACEAGELIRAIVAGADDDKLLEIASFYDYLEIQPIGNNAFLLRDNDNFPNIQTEQDLININLKVAELAEKLGKMLIATCDVHFLNAKDSIYRAILMKGKGFADAEKQPPLYLRTTEEMLKEFSYLGEEKAYEAVVTNPRKIADMVEVFKPIPDELYSPMIPGADEQIHDMSYARARELYGENLPKVVQDRLELELNSIIGHGFAVLYLIAHKLVKKSLDDGYLVGSRGSVGSSFVATMTNITEVNPLPPHWRCPYCKHSEFVEDGTYGCGFDMPDKICPHCGTKMIKDGHDIPFAVFMGFDGDKVPDIDLNFSGDYQPVAHKYTEELFGKDNVFRAGTIATVADKTAYGYVKKFFDEKGIKKRDAYINSLVNGCTGVKRTTGQHPGGIMVIPRNMDVHHFTPIQHPADDNDTNTITTHFDYHSISSRLVKLDILGHDDPTVIKMLENVTHRDPRSIPFDDPATMSIFSSTEALGVTPEELGATSGTFGIPEFRTPFTRQMLDDTKPKKFSDLVRISGFSHGTNVWLDNAQDLITNGTCTVSDAISCRDDIMMHLIHSGLDPLFSFKTMEKVRKGKGLSEDDIKVMKDGGIPQWYIDSCLKIKYLFPRAHATAYVMMAYRIAFCKVHYPLAFYAAYFSIRAAEFDANIISRGKQAVRDKLDEIIAMEKQKKLSVKDKSFQVILELAWEMYLRGFFVEKVDLYKSSASKFILHEKSLLPPFTALTGISTTAANNIVQARKDGEFTSIDDLKKRASLTTTIIESLREHGCLNGLQENDQIALFS